MGPNAEPANYYLVYLISGWGRVVGEGRPLKSHTCGYSWKAFKLIFTKVFKATTRTMLGHSTIYSFTYSAHRTY